MQVVIAAVGAEVLPAAVVQTVEALVLRCFEQLRYRQSVLLKPVGEPSRAHLVDEFERAPLPVVAEAHGLIDVGNIIRGLRDQRRRIGERSSEYAPCVLADLAGGGE